MERTRLLWGVGSAGLGAGLGAGLMYWADPGAGERRRARAREATWAAAHGVSGSARGLARKTRIVVAGAAGRLRRQPVDARTLEEQVHRAITHAARHPERLRVQVAQGRVDLEGPVRRREHRRVLDAVARVPGVLEIDDGLAVLRPPALRAWARALAPGAFLTGGLALAGALVRRRGVGEAAGTLAGAVVLARLTRHGLRGLVPRARTQPPPEPSLRNGVLEAHRTLELAAPPDVLFGLWSHYENFPRFLSHVDEVQHVGHGQSRWRVSHPEAGTLSWDVVTTRFVPGERIAWRSAEGAPVESAGSVHLGRAPSGGTRLEVWLSYRLAEPERAGALARRLGDDLGARLEADLERVRTLLERALHLGPHGPH